MHYVYGIINIATTVIFYLLTFFSLIKDILTDKTENTQKNEINILLLPHEMLSKHICCFTDLRDFASLKRVSRKANQLLQFQNLLPSAFSSQECTKLLMYYAYNNMEQPFRLFFKENENEQKRALKLLSKFDLGDDLPLNEWIPVYTLCTVKSKRKSPKMFFDGGHQEYFWEDVFNDEVALTLVITDYFFVENKDYANYINMYDESGDSFLFCAIRKNNINIVKILLDRGACSDYCHADDEDTPLEWAVSAQRIDMVRALVEQNACIYTDSCRKYFFTYSSPLKAAINSGQDKMVEVLCKHQYHSTHDGKELLFYALLVAIEKRKHTITEILLKHGVDPNTPFGEDGCYSLRKARLKADPTKMVELLLKYNANPNLLDRRGYTTLDNEVMAHHSKLEVVKVLLKHNARSNMQKVDGIDVYEYAVQHNHHEIAGLLKEVT